MMQKLQHLRHTGLQLGKSSIPNIANLLRVSQAQFSRKTRPSSQGGKKGSYQNKDEAFTPPEQSDGESGEDGANRSTKSKNRVYVPKMPLTFDSDGRLLLFEVSHYMRRIPLFTVPSYFLSLASAMVMIDAFVAASFLKGAIFGVPFMTFLLFSTHMTQQASVIVQRIELLRDKEDDKDYGAPKKSTNTDKNEENKAANKSEDDESANDEPQYAEQVIIENLRGEIARINVSEIKPLNVETAKQYIMQQQSMKLTFPVFIDDLLMIIDRRGQIHNVELFRAVLNGYKIDLQNTQVPPSDKDDDIVQK